MQYMIKRRSIILESLELTSFRDILEVDKCFEDLDNGAVVVV